MYAPKNQKIKVPEAKDKRTLSGHQKTSRHKSTLKRNKFKDVVKSTVVNYLQETP